MIELLVASYGFEYEVIFSKNAINPIPHFRVGVAGRIIRIKKSEFDQWMETHRAVQGNEINELLEGIFK